jgi:hypothetical protein
MKSRLAGSDESDAVPATHFLQQEHWLALAPVLLNPVHLVNIHLQRAVAAADAATTSQQEQQITVGERTPCQATCL